MQDYIGMYSAMSGIYFDCPGTIQILLRKVNSCTLKESSFCYPDGISWMIVNTSLKC
jgi:hypothetical protein